MDLSKQNIRLPAVRGFGLGDISKLHYESVEG